MRGPYSISGEISLHLFLLRANETELGAQGLECFEQLGGIEWGVWEDREGQSQGFQSARLDRVGAYWFLLLTPSLLSQDGMPADFLQTSGKRERTGGYSTALPPLTGPRWLSPAWAHLAGPAPNSFSCKSLEFIL